MIAAFATEEAQARLAAEARSWLGTPYCGDGAVKGAGVSCALLHYEILHACGHGTPRPVPRRELPRRALCDVMKSWIGFEPEHFAPILIEQMIVGDVALINAGIGHLLMMIDPDNFIHCWANGGVQMVSIKSPRIVSRIVGVWRPII